MKHLFSILAALALLVCVAHVKAEENADTVKMPVIIAVQVQADMCEANREIMVLNDLYGEGNVFFYSNHYQSFVKADPNWKIIEFLKEHKVCQELTDGYGAI